MRVAIMQPYFFPYIGYFQLINAVDKFVLLDEVQFIRHGWIERNRVLNRKGEWFYIKVPLKKFSRDTLIKYVDIRVEDWKNKILSQLVVYKRVAPNYYAVINLIKDVFQQEFKTITEINYYIIKSVCLSLEIKTDISIFSKMNIEVDKPKEAGDWALNISEKINAEEYINPIGGEEIFNLQKFNEKKIKIKFLKSLDIEYKQFNNEFVPWLSIIDVMMFNSKDEIKRMLKKYRLYE